MISHKKYPRVTVQVINYNGGEKIIRCLNSIKNLNYPNFDVVVFDNGSTDGTKEQIKRDFKKFKLIDNKENIGWVRSVKKGFKLLKNPFLLQLDDDVSIKKDLLNVLVGEMLKDEKIGVIIPKVYYYKTPEIISNIGFSINMWTGKTTTIGRNEKDIGQHDKQRTLECVPAAVMLIRKEVLDKIGSPSTDYFQYYGDAEWCLNIWKAGFTIDYIPATSAWHDEKTQMELPPFKLSKYTSDKIIFMKRNNSLSRRAFYLTSLILIYSPVKIIYFLLKLKPSLAGAYLSGLKTGLLYKKNH